MFRREHLRQALRLTRELGELPAGSAAQVQYLMQGVARLVGAVQSTLSRVEVGRAIVNVGAWGWTPGERALADRVYADCDGSTVDPLARALIVERSPSNAYARRDVVDDGEWYSSAAYSELRKPIGIDDAIYTKHALSPGSFASMALCRAPGERQFSAEDRNIVHLIGDEIASFCAPAARSGPLDEDAQPAWAQTLPPYLRRILDLLLTGRSEKEIADSAGLTCASTHQYIVEIYRRAGVHSRAELMARALARARQ